MKKLSDDQIIELIPVMPYEVEWNVDALLAFARNIEKYLKGK